MELFLILETKLDTCVRDNVLCVNFIVDISYSIKPTRIAYALTYIRVHT